MYSKNKNQKKIEFVLIVLLLISFASAGSMLDNAKTSIDNFYKYSQEKDVESYTKLFDQGYLTGLYGADYKTFFKETFSYFEIKDYEIQYQYYTESNDSLTLFYNLKSNAVVNGENIKIDNDIVVFFIKKNNELKIRFVMLQETFIGQMNQEMVIKGAILGISEESEDISIQAEKKGLLGVNMEKVINKFESRHSVKRIFWWIFLIALVILGYFLYKNPTKIKNIKENGKIFCEKTGSGIKNFYRKKALPFLTRSKKFIILFCEKSKTKIILFYNKKFLPFYKNLIKKISNNKN